MRVSCDCDDWKEGMNSLEDMSIFCLLHYEAPRYEGKTFKYCPWCGKELCEILERFDDPYIREENA